MAVVKNSIGIALALGFLLVAPSAPKDPPVAATMGFFLDNWQSKSWVAPDSREGVVGTGPAPAGASTGKEGRGSVEAANVITKIPPSIYGHNANTWMTTMITEPVF